MVTLQFLGSAQDGGIPHLGCDCANCMSIHRKVACLGITGQQHSVIIDATFDIEHQIREFGGLDNIDSIFLTHLHTGHYCGLLHLGKEVANTTQFPVYVSSANKEFLMENKPFSYLVDRGQVEYRVLSTDQKIEFGDFSIISFEVPHRNEDGNTYGYEIKTSDSNCLYIPDIDYLDKNTIQRMKRADTVIFDGTFYSAKEIGNQENVPHPPIESTVKQFGRIDIGKKRFYFTHFNHSNPILNNIPLQNELRKKGYMIAEDGMKFELD